MKKYVRGERKRLIYFSICVRTVPNLERYHSPMLNLLAFGTSEVRVFLVFGVPNAKFCHLAHSMLVFLMLLCDMKKVNEGSMFSLVTSNGNNGRF